MEIQKLVSQEIGLINRLLQANKVRARASLKSTAVIEVGYIRYGVMVADDEKFARVDALHREMSALLTSHRRRAGMGAKVLVIPTDEPVMGLEVPHPQPKPLLWSPRAVTSGQPHTMLIGRSYLAGPREERVSFADVPHILICGITGAGKTMLLQTMLLSLCAATSPADLRLVLVDLKNEDLVPFENLPHVLTFAGTKAAAVDAIRFVVDEKNRRIEQRGYKPYRVVLVIDEMAQLAGDGEVRDMLGDLASIGRSKWINMIGATQSVTEKGGLGALLKANFAVRLVGQVAPGMSYVATGRPQTHADLLPGKGAFLRCEGARVERFQSYFIDANDVALMAKYIAKDVWGGASEPVEPVHSRAGRVLVVEPPMNRHEPVHEPVLNRSAGPLEPVFPLADKRALNDAEALLAWRLYDNLSKSEVCRKIYGAKSGRYMEWTDAGIMRGMAIEKETGNDGKIITLRRAS